MPNTFFQWAILFLLFLQDVKDEDNLMDKVSKDHFDEINELKRKFNVRNCFSSKDVQTNLGILLRGPFCIQIIPLHSALFQRIHMCYYYPVKAVRPL